LVARVIRTLAALAALGLARRLGRMYVELHPSGRQPLLTHHFYASDPGNPRRSDGFCPLC
jgi:hypothetical protein